MTDAIDIQGGLLSRDFLERLRQGDVPGGKAGDYDVAGRLEDRITGAWNELRDAHNQFKVKRSVDKNPSPEDAYVVTRDSWIRFVFDSLRYGHLIEEKAPLRIEEETYPIRFTTHGVPIHVVGHNQDLDLGPSGTARGNPHSLLQEYLNRKKSDAWGILTNGREWRILRNNAASTRASYISFDLEAVMERFDEFTLWWRVAHASRILPRGDAVAWLETWTLESDRQGTRALVDLRLGVEGAIEELGRGFLKHPRNDQLRAKLADGSLSPQDYYRQVLQLVYRLIFLFVTEDRTADGKPLLLDPNATAEIRRLYLDHYSTKRLRKLATETRGSQHHDAYEALKVVVQALKNPAGAKALGLVGLNGSLWGTKFCTDLDGAHIRNLHFFQALKRLTRIKRKDAPPQTVDYQRLDAEELGSVYEALLELVPAVNPNERTFTLVAASGNERKTTGSYYTPSSIIAVMLDHSIEPLLDEACAKPEPEKAILALKVCDPTCGSGHFLVAAARRIARRLASVRTGEKEPGLQVVRHAVRDVIAHCIYGVDINPMAVELCKVSLWLEAMEPGKPLTFLEHKIQCGNAVIGATPLLLRNRLPDAAFNPVEGDDKAACREYRDRNREHLLQQVTLHGFKGVVDPAFHASLVRDIEAIEALKDDTVSDVQEKERQLVKHQRAQKFAVDYANAWCAAFFQIKQPNDPLVITQETLNHILEDPELVAPDQWTRIEALRKEYNFFHWHLAFPEVFAIPSLKSPRHYEGGFDLLLGNPPWDALTPDEKEFFSRFAPEFKESIVEDQVRIREGLMAIPTIADQWNRQLRQVKAGVEFMLESGRYTQFAGGKHRTVNLFRLVVEHGVCATREGGIYAQVLPEAFYKSASCGTLRIQFFREAALKKLFTFLNTGGIWFPAIHKSTKFCVAVAQVGSPTKSFRALFNVTEEGMLPHLDSASFDYPIDVIQAFSPEDIQVAEFESKAEIGIATRMYDRCPQFGIRSAYYVERPYAWELHMGHHRTLFHEEGEMPLMEGVMIWHYDYRAAGYSGGRVRSSLWIDYPFGDSRKGIVPQWRVDRASLPDGRVPRIDKFRVAFRDVASPESARCMVAAIVPPRVVCGHSLPTVVLTETWMLLLWVAIANSLSMDWLCRQKVALHMTYSVIDTLPFPNLARGHPLVKEVVKRAARLVCAGDEMQELWASCETAGLTESSDGPEQDTSRRMLIQSELDAIVAKQIYGLTRDEFEKQLGAFEILARQEQREFGEFRTKHLALEAYDALPADFPTATRDELWGTANEVRATEATPKGTKLAKGQATLTGQKQVRL